MNQLFKLGAMALAVSAAFSTAAYADNAETKGGIKISTDDGRFDASIGGRIQYDYSTVETDNVAASKANGAYLRRAYLTLSGKLYGFKYKFENDFAGSSVANKEVWIGRDVLGGLVRVGHMQPAYGMESLTSSNDLLFTERPFISSNTIYAGREFQNAITYNGAVSGFTGAVSLYDATPDADKDAGKSGGGRGYAGRVTFAPLTEAGSVVHVGISYDAASFRTGTGPAVGAAAAAKAAYVSKNGPTLQMVAGGYEDQKTVDVELAGGFGPAFVQAEYAQAKYSAGALTSDQTLSSYYIQTSVFVTGESKPYKAANGVFGNPKPKNDFGAIELKARYDVVKNKDDVNAPKATELSFGVNYYFNPNVRFMLDYNVGKAETATTEDKPRALVARAQLSF